MPHPNGGKGNTFRTTKTFADAYALVGAPGISFSSTTGETINATQSLAQDGVTLTIEFHGINNRHGNVCEACWGFRESCTGSRIGQCTDALDLL